MKTSELTHICPYTGLRSFTEEESLYFKGRDYQVDQITSLLEQNKFLMVTGASGEGKSSLIYAGLIPNARAGFFQSSLYQLGGGRFQARTESGEKYGRSAVG